MNNRKSPQLPLSAYSHLNLEQILNFPKPSHYSSREVAQPVKVLTTQVRRCEFNAHNPPKKLGVGTCNCNPTLLQPDGRAETGGSPESSGLVGLEYHTVQEQKERLLTRGKARTNVLKVIL